MTRNYRGALMMGVFMLAFVGVFLLAPAAMPGDGVAAERVPVAVPLITTLLIVTPMMTINIAFDFRRDLDRMAILKSFPIPAVTMALGQIVPTALLLCFWQLAALTTVVLLTGDVEPRLAAGLALVLVPLNAVLVAMDNILFLKMPYRVVAADPGRMPFMPRLMIVAFIKMLMMALAVALAIIPAFIVWRASASVLAAAFAAAVLLATCFVPIAFATAAAFRSFDVGRDVPD